MKDTIYREDAIKAFDTEPFIVGDAEAAINTYSYMCDVIRRIKNLPSAEPQDVEKDIRAMCGECDAWNQYKNYSQLRWIPCSETVDIPDHEVLACDKYGEEILGYLEYTDEQWICASEDCVMYDPIAWMEKPEPFAERKQDE